MIPSALQLSRMLMSACRVSSVTRTFATCACASWSVCIDRATDGVGSGATSTARKLLGRKRYWTSKRSRNRSKSASSSFPSGSSFEAPKSDTSGICMGAPSLWKRRSFMAVSRELRMAEFALNTSSTNANSASGSLAVVTRW